VTASKILEILVSSRQMNSCHAAVSASATGDRTPYGMGRRHAGRCICEYDVGIGSGPTLYSSMAGTAMSPLLQQFHIRYPSQCGIRIVSEIDYHCRFNRVALLNFSGSLIHAKMYFLDALPSLKTPINHL